jgi:hypothetical protein
MSREEFKPNSTSSNILVVNSKGNLHSFRFSLETVLLLNEKKYNVSFIDLGHYDPEFSGIRIIKTLLRNIFETNNYRKAILKKLYVEKITIIKPRFNYIHLCETYLFSFVRIFFGKELKISKKELIPINSWVATRVGHTKYEWSTKNRYTAYQALVAIKKTELVLNNLLKKYKYDYIYTFNGRFPVDSSVLLICESNRIPYYVYDGGALSNDNYNRIQYFRTSPHNLSEIKEKVNKYWDSESEYTRETVALNTLQDLVRGKRTLGSSSNWIKNHNSLNFQANWSKTVVYFSSSDWEQGAISKWKSKLGFLNQFEAVEQLYNACTELGLDLMIKTHPILKNYRGKRSESAEMQVWNKFAEDKKVTVLGIGDYSISPYELMNKAKVNVCFKTSLSAQAMYLRKKVIILTDTLWRSDSLNANYADNYDQILNQLNYFLETKAVEYNLLPVYKWAYYQSTHGARMKFSDFHSGKFKIL